MRFFFIVLLIVPVSTGFLVGLIVNPFIHGFLAAYEIIGDFIASAPRRTFKVEVREREEA